MNLDKEIISTVQARVTEGEFELNVVVREIVDEDAGSTYYVAECIEIPGCVSDGATPDEAKQNIENAMRLCLSVILEDAMKQLTMRKALPDLRKVVGQGRLRVHAIPELQYA